MPTPYKSPPKAEHEPQSCFSEDIGFVLGLVPSGRHPHRTHVKVVGQAFPRAIIRGQEVVCIVLHRHVLFIIAGGSTFLGVSWNSRPGVLCVPSVMCCLFLHTAGGFRALVREVPWNRELEQHFFKPFRNSYCLAGQGGLGLALQPLHCRGFPGTAKIRCCVFQGQALWFHRHACIVHCFSLRGLVGAARQGGDINWCGILLGVSRRDLHVEFSRALGSQSWCVWQHTLVG